ncbi:MAG: hypothetical protein LBS33_03535 [Streptococcaceae bacterium]|nr:hypothetical protein [Streptococcaceae bacterium]
MQNIGWESWKTNGGTAGTVGQGLRTEAFQVYTTGKMGITYRVHVQEYGWLGWVNSTATYLWGNYAGTTGQARRLEAIQFQLYEQEF